MNARSTDNSSTVTAIMISNFDTYFDPLHFFVCQTKLKDYQGYFADTSANLKIKAHLFDSMAEEEGRDRFHKYLQNKKNIP